ELRQRCAQSRLVVGDVAQGGISFLDAVAERRAAVIDRLRSDAGRADLPLQRLGLTEGDMRRELAHLDRSERRRYVAGDAVAQRGLGRRRSPDGDLGLWPERWGEEHQPLD